LNGPGMTYGVYSIVANEISSSGCASYTYDLYGSEPYIRAPWFQYSEQLIDNYNANGGTHPAYPFLTGMGGAYRVAIFGYLGLRLMVDVLNVDPALPPQIPYIEYRTFYWQGHALKAWSNQTHTSISRTGMTLANANSTYISKAIPVSIGLTDKRFIIAPNSTIILDNRRLDLNKTVPGNIAQCQRVESAQDYLEGQFPLSAVDGSISTKWQPIFANESSMLTVELVGSSQPISSFHFDWAQLPPQSYKVVFSNSSSFPPQSTVNVSSSDKITISSPYDPVDAAFIVPYASNTTNVTIDPPVWSGRYARLAIYGTQSEDFATFKNGSGAMVAEWAIIGASGQAVQSAKRSISQTSAKTSAPLWKYENGRGGQNVI